MHTLAIQVCATPNNIIYDQTSTTTHFTDTDPHTTHTHTHEFKSPGTNNHIVSNHIIYAPTKMQFRLPEGVGW